MSYTSNIDYVYSDPHFHHENIIEYCNRPFSSVEEMDKMLLHRWNNMVSEDETVLFLGDLAMAPQDKALRTLHELNGEILFIRGNHDDILFDTQSDIMVYNSITFEHRGLTIPCTHYPEEPPDDHTEYVFHGHTHNNDLDTYPFFNPHNRTFNFSAELLGYTPLPYEYVAEILFERKSTVYKEFTEHLRRE